MSLGEIIANLTRLEYLFAEYEKKTAAGQAGLLAVEPAKVTKPRKKKSHA